MIRPVEKSGLTEPIPLERCIRHRTEFVPILGCPFCELEEEKKSKAARISGRARFYGLTDVSFPPPPDDRNLTSLHHYCDGDEEEGEPRQMMLPVPGPVPFGVTLLIAAVVFLGALLAGWMLGYKLNLWGYPL